MLWLIIVKPSLAEKINPAKKSVLTNQPELLGIHRIDMGKCFAFV